MSTITQSLAKVTLLDKQIDKKIRNLNVCAIAKVGEAPKGFSSREEVEAAVSKQLQSIGSVEGLNDDAIETITFPLRAETLELIAPKDLEKTVNEMEEKHLELLMEIDHTLSVSNAVTTL